MFSDAALREQKAVRIFLVVRASRALIRAEKSWWPLDRMRARWVAGALADSAHCIERGEHHDEQAQWLSPIEIVDGEKPLLTEAEAV